MPWTKGGDRIARGVARNTEDIRQYLSECPAVESFKWDQEIIQFVYDPKRVPSKIPDGVYFDLTEAPF